MKQNARRDRPLRRAVRRKGERAFQMCCVEVEVPKLPSTMESSNAGYSDAVTTGSGTVASDTDGTIRVTGGSGGERTITGSPVNLSLTSVDSEADRSIVGMLLNPAQSVVDSTHYKHQSDLPSTGFRNQGTA